MQETGACVDEKIEQQSLVRNPLAFELVAFMQQVDDLIDLGYRTF